MSKKASEKDPVSTQLFYHKGELSLFLSHTTSYEVHDNMKCQVVRSFYFEVGWCCL